MSSKKLMTGFELSEEVVLKNSLPILEVLSCVKVERSVFGVFLPVRYLYLWPSTYSDNSIILHKSLLGPSKQTQESQNQRRRAQHNRYESREAHACEVVVILSRSAIHERVTKFTRGSCIKSSSAYRTQGEIQQNLTKHSSKPGTTCTRTT